MTCVELPVTLLCDDCGCDFQVSARHARLIRAGVHPRKCRRHARPSAQRKPPDDTDRRFWLERFSDMQIAELASVIYDVPLNPESVAVWRESLYPQPIAV